LNKHKCLQQFFKFLLGEDEISRSLMERVPQPKTPRKLIPVMPEQDTRSLLDALKGKGFAGLQCRSSPRKAPVPCSMPPVVPSPPDRG
jgi:site-specific recombinase XerD